MTVRCIRKGLCFPYRLDGTVLTLGTDFSLDLAALMQEESTHVVISAEQDGRLVLGPAWRYVAELELPARSYRIEKIGVADDFGFPALRRLALPPVMDEVILTLWPEKEDEYDGL